MLKNIYILKLRTPVAGKQLSYNVIEERGIKLSGTWHTFFSKPEGCIDSFCLPFFPFISPLSHFLCVIFFSYYSRCKEFNRPVQHTTFSIPYPHYITSRTLSRTALLSFPLQDLPTPAGDCNPRPSLLMADMLCASVVTHVLYEPLSKSVDTAAVSD